MSTPLFPVGQAAVDALCASQKLFFQGFSNYTYIRVAGRLSQYVQPLIGQCHAIAPNPLFAFLWMDREARFNGPDYHNMVSEVFAYQSRTGHIVLPIPIYSNSFVLEQDNVEPSVVLSSVGSLNTFLLNLANTWQGYLLDGDLKGKSSEMLEFYNSTPGDLKVIYLKHGTMLHYQDVRSFYREHQLDALSTNKIFVPTESYIKQAEYTN